MQKFSAKQLWIDEIYQPLSAIHIYCMFVCVWCPVWDFLMIIWDGELLLKFGQDIAER